MIKNMHGPKYSQNQKPNYHHRTEKLTDRSGTELLNKKKNALPKMASNKAGYNSVMAGIQSAFPSKMKTVLKAQQYATLLGLMPKSPSSTNILLKLLF